MGREAIIGAVGKLPSRGDFLAEGLPQIVREPFERLLTEAIALSELGNGAHADLFLTGPAWRFSIRAGLIGPLALAGVIVPSVDGGSRMFPFSVLAILPDDIDVPGFMDEAPLWFDQVEARALAALDPDFGEVSSLVPQIPNPPRPHSPAAAFQLPAQSVRTVKAHNSEGGLFDDGGLEALLAPSEGGGAVFRCMGLDGKPALDVVTSGIPRADDLRYLFIEAAQ